MKKFLLVLFAAGLTSTAAFAQAGGPAGDPSDEVTVTVSINDWLSLAVTSGDNLVWNLSAPEDYTNPAVTRLSSGLRISSAKDNAAVYVYGDLNLTDASTGEVIPAAFIEYTALLGATASYTPISVSASAPGLVTAGLPAGINDITVSNQINIPFGAYRPGNYTGTLYYTAVYE